MLTRSALAAPAAAAATSSPGARIRRGQLRQHTFPAVGGATVRTKSTSAASAPAAVARLSIRAAAASSSSVSSSNDASPSSSAARRRRRGAALVPTAVAEPTASTSDAVEDAKEDAFNWHMHWYPVAFISDLVDGTPTPFTLLGEPLVFWRDTVSGEYRCTADKCPHRLVPLSEGRVNEKGEIECGYHGWTFDGKDGKCTSIPQLPKAGTALDTALASPRSCVTPYPTAVAQGMLWVLPINALVAPVPEDRPPLPLIPELEDPDCVVQDIFRDLPMDYGTLLENVMDVSHVPFTHHNSVGKRENATPVVLEMEGPLGPEGFTGIWKEGPRNGKYGSQYTQFQAPSLMRHTLKTDQFTTLTVVYAVRKGEGGDDDGAYGGDDVVSGVTRG